MNINSKIKYSILTWTAICVSLLVLFSKSNLAQAEENMGPSISVAPHTFDITAEPGEEISKKIKIYNRSNLAIPLSIKVKDFDAMDETGELIAADKESPVSHWLDFNEENLIVDPGKTEEINFTLKIPSDAELKGYYALIFLEADISTYFFNESKLQVIPGLGVPFMLKVGDLPSSDTLTVLEYSVSADHRLPKIEKALNFLAKPFLDGSEIPVVESGEPSFVVKLKNNGAYHVKLIGEINLSGLGWKLENDLELPPSTVLPGRTRIVTVKGVSDEKMPEQKGEAETAMRNSGKQIGFGLMQAKLSLESDQNVKKEEKKLILVFSWTVVFITVSLLIFVSILVLWLKRRKNKVGPRAKSERKKTSRSAQKHSIKWTVINEKEKSLDRQADKTKKKTKAVEPRKQKIKQPETRKVANKTTKREEKTTAITKLDKTKKETKAITTTGLEKAKKETKAIEPRKQGIKPPGTQKIAGKIAKTKKKTTATPKLEKATKTKKMIATPKSKKAKKKKKLIATTEPEKAKKERKTIAIPKPGKVKREKKANVVPESNKTKKTKRILKPQKQKIKQSGTRKIASKIKKTAKKKLTAKK